MRISSSISFGQALAAHRLANYDQLHPHRHRTIATGITLLAAALMSSPAAAAQVQSRAPTIRPTITRGAGAAAAPAETPTITSELIKVTISPSRPEVVPNGSYGVYADLENISSVPVMIFPEQTALIVLPEAAEPGACVNWGPGIFPTETPMSKNQADAGWKNPLTIQPGEHYKVFWDLEPASAKNAAIADHYRGDCDVPPSYWNVLGFVPGEYAFTVEGNAYTKPDASAKEFASSAASTPGIQNSTSAQPVAAPASNDLFTRARAGQLPVHHFSETKTLHVGISQLTTLLAAMLGALMAYWVTALRDKGDWDAFLDVMASEVTATRKSLAFLSLVRNMFLASLLGGVVTIVASRLSDTHFPVKVSVSDWWGALTIGFVAYFIGNKFVDGLANLGSSGSDASSIGRRSTPKPGSGEPASKPTNEVIPQAADSNAIHQDTLAIGREKFSGEPADPSINLGSPRPLWQEDNL